MPSNVGPLASLSLGQDVAEHDENLEAYFLATSTYWAVVQDQTDVVLGAKGTGKSAIARYLSRADISVPELDDVLLIPAFNLRGSVLFRRLSESTQPSDESAYRDLFLAYIIGLTGNHLIETYNGTAADVAPLQKIMQSCGLATQSNSVHSIWRRALERLTPRIETTVTVSDEDADDSDRVIETVTLERLERILDAIYEFLEKYDVRCWVMFDRLDEAFADNQALESTALRGLLRAQLDACSFGSRLRAKLFLRLDIFERITESAGFVNATHLRVTRIAWDADSIHHLVALRLKAWDERAGGLHGSVDLGNPAARRRLCRKILPKNIDQYDSLVWLLLVTVDGTREYNPRNIITLLRNAQLEEIQISTRNAEDIETKPAALSRRALAAGYKQLSLARLNDTLYAESGIARENIPKLRGRRTRFTGPELGQRLGIEGDDLDGVIRVLIYTGFLRIDEDAYLIPPLYRPALFSSTHKAELVIGATDFESLVAAGGTAVADEDEPTGPNGSSDSTDAAEAPTSVQGARPRRKRTRSRRRNSSGRDEFIPTGARSEVVDEVSFAAEIHAELDIEPDEIAEGGSSTSVPPIQRDSVPVSSGSGKTSQKRTVSPGAQAVLVAREMGDQGDAAGGFWHLHPNYTNHDGAACVAADLAYLSAEPSVVATARLMLSTHLDAGATRGRSLVFALGENDAVETRRILASLKRESLQSFTIGIVRMVAQAPDREASFWRRSLELDAVNNLATPMRGKWSILAASRVLAICRYFWESGTDYGFVGVSGVRDLIWDQQSWAESVRHVLGWTWAYVRDDPGAMPLPTMLPYQVLSCATVLESVGRLSVELRAALVDRLSRQVEGLQYEHKQKFSEWAQYTPIVMELLEGPDGRAKFPVAVSTPPAKIDASVTKSDVELVVTALELQRASREESSILLALLGSRLRRISANFDYRAKGFGTLVAFVTACTELDPRLKLARNEKGHPYVWLDLAPDPISSDQAVGVE